MYKLFLLYYKILSHIQVNINYQKINYLQRLEWQNNTGRISTGSSLPFNQTYCVLASAAHILIKCTSCSETKILYCFRTDTSEDRNMKGSSYYMASSEENLI